MISLAMDLAEEHLRNGTASSQVIVHYLKLGSSKENLEKSIMKSQKKLIDAKAESISSDKDIEQMYKEAVDAMKLYKGSIKEGDDE